MKKQIIKSVSNNGKRWIWALKRIDKGDQHANTSCYFLPSEYWIYFIATPKVKIPLSAPCFQFNEIKRVTVTKIKTK